MRGKADRTSSSQVPAGITPAYAGKRRRSANTVGLLWDHPRLCGEKYVDVEIANDYQRITPAYAGKRLKRS